MSRPHKCPVCKAKQPAQDGCRSCDGKGIVWEPEVTEAVASVPVPIPKGTLDLTYGRDE